MLNEIATRTGPTIKRGKSVQEVGTPPEFIEAVEKRFGVIDWDLAATSTNKVSWRDGTGREDYFGPDHPRPEYRDALATDWDIDGTLWLNPPFANIAPWAAKCCSVRDRLDWTLLLVPASVDAEWYMRSVHGKAFVMPLRGRLQFVGSPDPYPKGLMLAAFGFGVSGFEPWRWRAVADPIPIARAEGT